MRPTATLVTAISAMLSLGACAPKAPSGAAVAPAADQAIRKALVERMKQLPPIDEVRQAAIPGLFEVRFGSSQILYTDAAGRYIVEGALIDTQTMANLTEARLDALTAVKFEDLPLKDALVYKQGDGSRKLAVFADPNCGYCKRFERDLMALPNLTLYTFVMPILGADSMTKSRNIWCAADPAKAWRDWMIDGKAAQQPSSACDAEALQRNTEFGRRHRIRGTPGLVFADGSRKSGAVPPQDLEARIKLVSAKGS